MEMLFYEKTIYTASKSILFNSYSTDHLNKHFFFFCLCIRACFVPMVNHKFRATLGKSKLVSKSERVLVCVSGSQCSVTLLHLIWTGLQQSTFKRLTFKPIILYLDGNIMANVFVQFIILITLKILQKVFYLIIPKVK